MMKAETRLIIDIFGELAGENKDEQFRESVNGITLRDALLGFLDEISARYAYAAPKLSQRAKPIVMARYGFNDGQMKSYQELGRMFGVTRERTRQIVERVLRILRHPSKSNKLKLYIK